MFSVDDYAYDDDSLKQNETPQDSYVPGDIQRKGSSIGSAKKARKTQWMPTLYEINLIKTV